MIFQKLQLLIRRPKTRHNLSRISQTLRQDSNINCTKSGIIFGPYSSLSDNYEKLVLTVFYLGLSPDKTKLEAMSNQIIKIIIFYFFNISLR